MSVSHEVEQAFDNITMLLERYSLERRATTQPFLLQTVQEANPKYEYDPNDLVIRETLLEHVGSLPVVATALFPHIDDPEVNLGDSLTMLAIHDIGELETGDTITFVKKASEGDEEQVEALKLLDPFYHDIYRDVEEKGSKSAKFAKSIDKITPDFFDYLTPADITIWRMKNFANIEPDQIINIIVQHKRPYHLWSPFMTELHKYLMDRLAEKLGQIVDISIAVAYLAQLV
ncbi:MAG TPA: HD domain-containing protein [Candidatus Saccharimonadales bacterium]